MASEIKSRFMTLRALLLVLTIFVQTVGGGAVLARAASLSPEETLSAQCHTLRAGEQRAPDGRSGHGHRCQSCVLCCEPPPACVSLDTGYFVAFTEYRLSDAPMRGAPLFTGRLSRAHSARAPPSRA